MTEPEGQEADPLIGEVVAEKYLTLAGIGEGAMGRVYRARHLGLDRLVALKVLSAGTAAPDAEERFLREARTLADIDHANVVRVTDFGHIDSRRAYIVMELVEGVELTDALAESGPMPWPRVRDIVVQICRGLAAAHEAGVVHRDVKPENVILVEKKGDPDFVKLLDFGIARSTALGGRRLTRAGSVFGTPEYMAPEQARTSNVDLRADIYAVGILAFELLTGDVPFTGDDVMEVLWQQTHEPVPPPSSRVPELSDLVDSVVLKALIKDPELRYASMSEFAEAMESLEAAEAIRTGVEVTMPEEPAVTRPSAGPRETEPSLEAHATGRGRVAYFGAAAMLAAVAVGTWMFWARSDPQPPPPPNAASVVTAPENREPVPTAAPEPPSPPVDAVVGEPEPEPPGKESRDAKPLISAGAKRRAFGVIGPRVTSCAGRLVGGKKGDRIAVRLVVAADGSVASAQAVGKYAGEAVGSCVANAVKRARFNAPGKRTKFTHRFTL